MTNKIRAISAEGVKRRLIYNDTILLVSRKDQLIFEITDELVQFKLNIFFTDDGKAFDGKFDVSDEGKIVNLRLSKWYSTSWVENISAFELTTKKDVKLWIKYRTQSTEDKDLRLFYLSIWAQEN